jgi:thiosulfate/3-mercaptopyruvate sulfurtransferase
MLRRFLSAAHRAATRPTAPATCALIAVLGLATAAAGQAPEAAPLPDALVSADWLAQHLAVEPLIVLDVGARRERYDEGHIPGARFFPPDGFFWEGDPPVGAEMRTPAAIEAALEAAGAGEDGRIVVYGESPLLAARAWMTLDAMGLGARASLLDGGLGAWNRHGRPLATEAPAFDPGHVTLSPRAGVIVDADWVSARLDDPELTLVDARSDEEYTGADGGMGGKAHAGHVPGAFSIPWEELVESREVPIFYDGSWRDWGARDLPYVSGSSRR